MSATTKGRRSTSRTALDPRSRTSPRVFLCSTQKALAVMPIAAKRPCTFPGCGALTEDGRCPKHRRAEAREHDARRGSSTERLYSYRWQQASKAFLSAHPLCMCDDCKAGDLRVTAATVVDHHIPHRGDRALFWDSTNWRSMSKPCHDAKTAREDGGFGNRGRVESLAR